METIQMSLITKFPIDRVWITVGDQSDGDCLGKINSLSGYRDCSG